MTFRQFILLGPAGIDIRSQAIALADRWSVAHIPMDELIERAIAQDSPLGNEIRAHVEAEEEIPDALVMKVLRKRLEQPDAMLQGWVLDGFPNTLPQAQTLNDWLTAVGQPAPVAVYLKVMAGLLVNRLWNEQGQHGSTAPIQRRVEQHQTDVAPILEYYRQRSQLTTINGSVSAAEIAHELAQLGYEETAGAARMIKDEAELDSLLAQKSLLVVDCIAAWCGSCKQVAPMIDQLATTYGDRVNVMKIDFDANRQISKRFGLKGMPTVMFFKDGELMETLTGVKSYQTYDTVLTRFLE
ncbi:MAG: nucleoside monophosphate kinase [Leptolyngbyaceae bacterium]|nr:nucleoside monophosphate kinase [Leptolyngbyaceae bacterium]